MNEPNIVEVVELKQSHFMVEGHPSEFRMDFMHRPNMPIMGEDNKLFPMDTFEVEQKYAKKFIIHGEPRWIIWSMELESLVGIPLRLFEEKEDQINQLDLRLKNAQSYSSDLEAEVNRWQDLFCNRRDECSSLRKKKKKLKGALFASFIANVALIGLACSLFVGG